MKLSLLGVGDFEVADQPRAERIDVPALVVDGGAEAGGEAAGDGEAVASVLSGAGGVGAVGGELLVGCRHAKWSFMIQRYQREGLNRAGVSDNWPASDGWERSYFLKSGCD